MTASPVEGAEVRIGELLVRFAVPMDELARWELQQKEWCSITVETDRGAIGMEIISLVRFQQETHDAWENGRAAVIDVPTLIVETVDFDSVLAEVERLHRNGWFAR